MTMTRMSNNSSTSSNNNTMTTINRRNNSMLWKNNKKTDSSSSSNDHKDLLASTKTLSSGTKNDGSSSSKKIRRYSTYHYRPGSTTTGSPITSSKSTLMKKIVVCVGCVTCLLLGYSIMIVNYTTSIDNNNNSNGGTMPKKTTSSNIKGSSGNSNTAANKMGTGTNSNTESIQKSFTAASSNGRSLSVEVIRQESKDQGSSGGSTPMISSHHEEDEDDGNEKDIIILPQVTLCQVGGWPIDGLLQYEDDTSPISLSILEATTTTTTSTSSSSSNTSSSNRNDGSTTTTTTGSMTQLNILASAVMDHHVQQDESANSQATDTSTTTISIKDALQSVLSKFRCDFREGDITQTARQWPIHRSRVTMEVLSSSNDKRLSVDNTVAATMMTMMLRCDIPTNILYKLNVKANDDTISYTLPTHGKIDEYDAKHGLHWQLSMMMNTNDGNDGDDEDDSSSSSWYAFGGPSKALCKKDMQPSSTPPVKALFFLNGVNGDTFRPRIYNLLSSSSNSSMNNNNKKNNNNIDHQQQQQQQQKEEESQHQVPLIHSLFDNSISYNTKSAICVIPTSNNDNHSNSNNKKYTEQDYMDWLYYQRHILGFHKVFYLDECGSDFITHNRLLQKNEIGLDIIHVPHIPHMIHHPHNTNTSSSSSSSSAELAKKRCTMLSQYYDIDYIMFVTKTNMFTNYIVPMNREKHIIPMMLNKAITDHRRKEDCSSSSTTTSSPKKVTLTKVVVQADLNNKINKNHQDGSNSNNNMNSNKASTSTITDDDDDDTDDDDTFWSTTTTDANNNKVNDDIISTFVFDSSETISYVSSSSSPKNEEGEEQEELFFYHVPSLLLDNDDNNKSLIMSSQPCNTNNPKSFSSLSSSNISVPSVDAIYVTSSSASSLIGTSSSISNSDIDEKQTQIKKRYEISLNLFKLSNWIRILLNKNKVVTQRWLTRHMMDHHHVNNNNNNDDYYYMMTQHQQQNDESSSKFYALSSTSQYGLCNSYLNDDGPIYGKAILTMEDYDNNDFSSSSSSAPHVKNNNSTLDLTFYNAEVAERSNNYYLVLSVYSENINSRNYSTSENGWGHIFQIDLSKNNNPTNGTTSLLLLPNLNCIYNNDNNHGSSVTVPGIWRIDGHLENPRKGETIWLECPIPQSTLLGIGPNTGVFDVNNMISVMVELAPEKSTNNIIETSSTAHSDANPYCYKSLRMIREMKICNNIEEEISKKQHNYDYTSIGCHVGCIDDNKLYNDPQAKCYSRCHRNMIQKYERFSERDIWTPLSSLSSTTIMMEDSISSINTGTATVQNNKEEDYRRQQQEEQQHEQQHSFLCGRDISICLRPLFLETTCKTCDGNILPITAERLIEWIEYHIFIGFDTIYILDRYGYQLLPLLQTYIKSHRVIHVPFPLLTDVSISPNGRSIQSSLIPAGHDQILAYNKCLSISRKRNDAYMALTDSDEYIRYPQKKSGYIRTVLSDLLLNFQRDNKTNTTTSNSHKDNNNVLVPDSILLNRYDVEVESNDGLVLKSNQRNPLYRYEKLRQYSRPHGKVLVQPNQIGIYGQSLIHSAYRYEDLNTFLFRKELTLQKHRVLYAPSNVLTIYHYRVFDDVFKKKKENQIEPFVEDKSLEWMYDIIRGQLVRTAGYDALYSLRKQGLMESGSKKVVDAVVTTDTITTTKDSRPTLLVGILTYCSNRDRRDAIRETWLSNESINEISSYIKLEYKFILGQASTEETSNFCTIKSLAEENTKHNDLIELKNTPENYQVLTRKVLGFINWAATNTDQDNKVPDFVLKTDDDSYVDLSSIVDRLIKIHDDTSTYPMCLGSQQLLGNEGTTAVMDTYHGGRWYTRPEDFPLDSQMYATGSGYVINKPLIEHISNQIIQSQGGDSSTGTFDVPWGPEKRNGWIEDGATGYVMRGAINRGGRIHSAWEQHDTWFDWYKYSDFKLTLVHHIEANEQYIIHDVLKRKNIQTTSTIASQLERVLPLRKPSPATKETYEQKTKWDGSYLDEPLSKMLTSEPPKFGTGPAEQSLMVKSSTLDPPTSDTDAGIKIVPTTIFEEEPMNGKDVIVVTGGCHNIGRYLVEMIQQGYARMSGPLSILVLDVAVEHDDENHKDECDIILNNTNLPIFVKRYHVDIRYSRQIYQTIQPYQERVRGIIHLAATSQVQQCQADVNLCKEVNVNGTKNILKVMTKLFHQSNHQTYLPWLIFASSREVYGGLDKNDPPVTEYSIVKPLNIYGQTKLDAEILIQKWVQATKFNAIVLRFTNVYGGCYDHQTRLVPKTISSLLNGQTLEIYGNSDKTISLVHIRDAVQALLLATKYASILQTDGEYDVYNVGGGVNHDVLNIVDLMKVVQASVTSVVVEEGSTEYKECIGCQKPPAVIDMSNKDTYAPEPDHFYSSIDKAHRIMGYHPSRTFDVKTITEYLHRCAVPDKLLPVTDTDNVAEVKTSPSTLSSLSPSLQDESNASQLSSSSSFIKKKNIEVNYDDTFYKLRMRRRDVTSSSSTTATVEGMQLMEEMKHYFMACGMFAMTVLLILFLHNIRRKTLLL